MAEIRRVVFAFPGNLATPTGGYAYDRRIIDGLRQLGWTVDLLPLGDGFPFPDRETLEVAEGLIARLPANATVVVDGLAFGCMAEVLERTAGTRRFVALVHHPLCKENGLSVGTASVLEEAERSALSFASEVVVTSTATAEQVAELFGILRGTIHTVCPGTDRATTALPVSGRTVKILSVGTIVPRKGHDLLLQALKSLHDLDWQLDIVGDTGRDRHCFKQLQTLLSELGLEGRVTIHGSIAPEDLAAHYSSADIFALASRYEGYGMAYAEALAHGLPVIGSGEGAVRDTLNVDGALYCDTGDIEKLSSALSRLIRDPALRAELSTGAIRSSRNLPTWQDASQAFARVLETGS